ncbi:MAG: hypothetical protein HQ463_00455 [Bacteroidetes bacterium]|nr:hypothetical protein [Bacteroidota bacterium]
MKNFKKLFLFASITATALTACKYEEGVGISFVAKRDRISNEWTVTSYKIDGTEKDSIKKSFSYGDSLELVWTIMRTGNYNMNLNYTKAYSDKNGGKMLLANASSNISEKLYDYHKNIIYSIVGSGGKWSFEHRHNRIQFSGVKTTDVSGSNVNQGLSCEILELRNKKVQLQTIAADGKKHTITLEPRNKEPKQFK